MLEKKDEVYAVTKLTQDGLDTLLTDNINFEIAGFAFIDDEVNYNLFNADQNIAKGSDRVNYYENDNTADVLSQAILCPVYRVEEVRNYLFGNTVKHRFTPDQIKTQADVRLDMVDAPIELLPEVIASRLARVFDFKSQVISGNIPMFLLNDNDLNKWSLAIDIRGTVTVYQGNDSVTLIEQANAFSNLSYTVRFHGDDSSKIFEYTKVVSPDEPLYLSTAQLKTDLGIGYQLYGTFYVFKTFTLEGVDYTSDVLQIELKKEPTQFDSNIILDGKAQILANYSAPYLKKNVSVNLQLEENWIEPRVYDNYITDQVLNQVHVPGYASLKKEPLRIRISASNINSFHLNLQNIANKQNIPYISVQGDPVDAFNYLTFPEFGMDLVIYRQLLDDGYYLKTNLSINDKFDFLLLDDATNDGQIQYSLFGEKRNKAYVKIQKSIFLGTQTHFESLNGTELLWYFTSPDQNILYNFKQLAPVFMNDYENLILDLNS